MLYAYLFLFVFLQKSSCAADLSKKLIVCKFVSILCQLQQQEALFVHVFVRVCVSEFVHVPCEAKGS